MGTPQWDVKKGFMTRKLWHKKERRVVIIDDSRGKFLGGFQYREKPRGWFSGTRWIDQKNLEPYCGQDKED